MSRLLTILAASAAVAAGAALPEPAIAQQGNAAQVIVYGDDPCPRSTDDEVVVCTRRPENERYRISRNLRPTGTRQQLESWAVRSKNLETAGATGIDSCSPVGPAGYTGCLAKQIQEARGERKQQADEENPPQ